MNIKTTFLLSSLCAVLIFGTISCGTKKDTSEQESEISEIEKEFLGEVERYVKENTNGNGSLPVKTIDGKSKSFDGPLTMTKLHRKKVITYDKEKNIYFVCSNFKSQPEEGEGTKYDFDFFMTKTDDGWKLSEELDWPPVLLHKIEGEEQVTYKNNKPVAVDAQ